MWCWYGCRGVAPSTRSRHRRKDYWSGPRPSDWKSRMHEGFGGRFSGPWDAQHVVVPRRTRHCCWATLDSARLQFSAVTGGNVSCYDVPPLTSSEKKISHRIRHQAFLVASCCLCVEWTYIMTNDIIVPSMRLETLGLCYMCINLCILPCWNAEFMLHFHVDRHPWFVCTMGN